MNSNKGLCICALLLTLLSVPGCVPVPEEVRNNAGLYENLTNEEDTDTSKLSYVSLAQLQEEAQQWKGKTYNQIGLPNQISIPPSDMAVLDMGNFVDTYSQSERLLQYFLPEYLTASAEYKDAFQSTQQRFKGWEYETSQDYKIWNTPPTDKYADSPDRSLGTNTYGRFFYANGWEPTLDQLDTDVDHIKRVAAFHISKEGIPDQSYSLSGQEESVAAAVAYTETTVNQWMEVVYGRKVYDYRVDWLFVISDGNLWYYSMVLNRTYNGVLFDDAPAYPNETEELYDEQDYLYGSYPLTVQMFKPDTIGFLREAYSLLPSEQQKVNSYLSLASAIQLVSSKLAAKNMFSFDNVSLCYTLRQDILTDVETGQRKYPFGCGLINYVDSTVIARPTWVFSIDRSRVPEYNDMNRLNGRSLTVLIDAIDGTFQYYTGDWGE